MSNLKNMTSDADKWADKFADEVAGKTNKADKTTPDTTHQNCVDKKVKASSALPFLKLAPWLLGLAVVSFILEPTIKSLELLWPVIITLGTVSGFMIYLKKTGRTYAQVAVTFPIIEKVVSGAFILAVLGSVILLIKWAVLTYMVDGLGISVRYSYMMAIGASPFILSGIWYIFKEQLPGKPVAVFFGSLLIAKALIATLIFVNYQSPEGYVDHMTGNVLKWYSKTEDRLYSSPGKDGFGNELVPAVEALKNAQKSDFGVPPGLAQKSGDGEWHQWRFTVGSANLQRMKTENPKGFSVATVSRSNKVVCIDVYEHTTLMAKFRGKSNDGKSYSGNWVWYGKNPDGGTFTVEFILEGSALGTMTTKKDGELTIDLRKWSVE